VIKHQDFLIASLEQQPTVQTTQTDNVMKFTKHVVMLTVAFALSGGIAVAQEQFATGLMAHYEFTGNTLDLTDNRRDFAGNLSFSLDRFGRSQSAADFKTGSPIASTSVMLGGAPGVSVTFWIKLTKTPAAGGERVVMHGSWNLGAGVFSFAVYPNFGRVDIQPPGQSLDTPSGALGVGEWHHCAFTCDGTTLLVAVDGVPTGSRAVSLATKDASIILGGDAGYYFVSGVVDSLRVYGRSVSAEEIRSLYLYEKSIIPSLTIAVKTVQLTLRVVTGKTYQLEQSDDLHIWVPYASPFVALSDVVTKDADVLGEGQYFRVREVASQ
jgi:hypothetical protein